MPQPKALYPLLLTSVLLLCACAQPIKPTTPQHVAVALIESGALVLDVRSAEEFSGGHLADALNIPVGQTDRMADAIGAEKNRLVVVYCGSGRRASIAQGNLAEMGYYNVHNGTGFNALKAAGAATVVQEVPSS